MFPQQFLNQADLFQGLNDIRCTVPQGLNDNRCIFLADTRNQLVHLHGRLVEADSVIQTRAVVLVSEPSQSDECEP